MKIVFDYEYKHSKASDFEKILKQEVNIYDSVN
jgi:hypothetical protein